MKRISALAGTTLFLILAPGTVAGVAPWWISRWRGTAPLLGMRSLGIAGMVLVIGGVLVLVESFVRFAWKGLGTPAPVFPTRHLVVSGAYRFVRNPMYVAVVSVILGQSLVLDSLPLLTYALCVWLCFHLFVMVYEEPTLRRSFGAEYEEFCANVPRWFPRLHPWVNGHT